jgi:hypothetical protein
MGSSIPDSWSRERSGARDHLVSVLYGHRSSGGGSTPPRPIFQRNTAAARSSQVVVGNRSITSPSTRLATKSLADVFARGVLPLEGGAL